jgi:predicted ATP-binding protein involved in virulence
MYIKKIKIKNIRSIIDFEMNFTNQPGWHVLIGDNGAGKSTIIRSISLALIGNLQAQGLTPNWDDWLNKKSDNGDIYLELMMDAKLDSYNKDYKKVQFDNNKSLFMNTSLKRKKNKEFDVQDYLSRNGKLWFSTGETEDWEGAFSVAYGPYRRFEGGSPEFSRTFDNPFYKDLVGHITAFSESVALSGTVEWLKELKFKSLEKNNESSTTLESLKELINSKDFLPHNASLEDVSSEGVFFKDGNGITISVNQMSDGYRSILSLTFDLIRHLVRVYGSKPVFKDIYKDEPFIDLPGVVLIDEVDAHLHPTWQTRIGQWFTKYFPKLQFIVTTHSPLVCRASKESSIWRLAAPNSEMPSGEITGVDKDRLIFGNILDAYGTDVFGSGITISKDASDKLNQMASLNIKSLLGKISSSESEKLDDLKAVFPTEKLNIDVEKLNIKKSDD